MFVAFIKCKDRFQKRIIKMSGKSGKFSWDGDEYIIVPDRCYRTRVLGIVKTFALDYVKGVPYPIDYWNVDPEGKGKIDIKPSYGVDKVVELIKRFIVGIPHFEIIMMLLGVFNILLSIGILVILNKAGLI